MKYSILTIAAASLLVCGTANAATISFQNGVLPTTSYSSAGLTIRSDQATTNQASNAQALVGQNGTPTFRSLFEFDLTAIRTAAGGNPFTIDSVTLDLRQLTGGGAGTESAVYDLHLLGANADFNGSTVTWNNAPNVAGGTVGTFLSSVTLDPTPASEGLRTFGNTAAFQTAVSSALSSDPNNTIRFLLKANDETGTNFSRFDSAAATTAANRPLLNVQYTIVPEPSSIALLALGGIAMVVRRRVQR